MTGIRRRRIKILTLLRLGFKTENDFTIILASI